MRILLLSTTTGYQLRSFGDAANRLGVRLIFGTDRCHSLDDPWKDGAVPVRFHVEGESLRVILDAVARRPINGVIAVGDRPVVLAAHVSEALELPGNPPAAAAASANKEATRRAFEKAGLPVPWYFVVRTTTDPAVAASRARFPCVVKPLGLSGSRGVIRANTREECMAAVQRVYALLSRVDVRAQRTGLEGDVLIEGFIEGREYALEGVLSEGDLQVLALFDKPDPLDGPFFEETLYVTPSALPPCDIAAIVKAVERAVKALGLWHGPIHAECRISRDGVYVLEVAARPIGGLCSKVLRFENDGRAGYSLEDVLLVHAIGANVSAFQQERRGAAVMMIPIPARGFFRGVEGEADARAVPHVEDVRITAKIDQLLEPIPEAGSYLGFIFARASAPADAERAVRAAHQKLQFKIAPELPLARST